MNVTALTLGDLMTNCYIADCGNGEAIVIDPAADAPLILGKLEQAGLKTAKILLTHGHFDHTAAADEIRESTGAPIYIHGDDVGMLSNARGSFAFFCQSIPFSPLSPDETLKDGDTVTVGEVTLEVISTPGHSAGSVCFKYESGTEENVIFTGDTLFKDSIGRSDGYTGDPEKLMQSLDKLAALKKDYILYPGHGPATRLSAEKRFNPFLAL